MKLKELVLKYGIDKINTLTKYPSIKTLHKIGDRGMLTNELATDISLDDELCGSEKVDGTNFRMICWGNEYLIGSRKEILTYSKDLCRNSALDIVDELRKMVTFPTDFKELTVIYGELYGGSVGKASKQYGTKNEYGCRIFDVITIKDLSILELDIKEISSFREYETDNGIVYGHDFLTNTELTEFCKKYNFAQVPQLPVDIKNFDHQTILDYLNTVVPKTLVALSDSAKMRSEGVVLRNSDRTKIVKLRFQNYTRTLGV